MNRRNDDENTSGVITIFQLILVVCLVIVIAVMPLFSTETYGEIKQFLSQQIGKNTGEEQANTIKDVFGQQLQGQVKKELASPNGNLSVRVNEPDAKKLLSPPQNATLSPYVLTLNPMSPIKNYQLTCPFGWRYHPITGLLDFHTGIDMAAKGGTPIVAALGGTVTKAGQGRVYGNFLQIQTGEITTFYGHCNTLDVAEGDVVEKGQQIATVGTTGLSTGNHLHFEIRINDVVVNPISAIS